MDAEQFKQHAHAAVDRIIAYNRNLSATPPSSQEIDASQLVTSRMSPGYLASRLPSTIPAEGESFESIQADLEAHIMPGITHWQSPNFMAYFPANSSYPGILGDMYSDMLTCAAFNWQASPAVTELETIVMDMLGSAIGLHEGFRSGGEGGGCLFGSASEAVLTMMMAARDRYLDDAEAGYQSLPHGSGGAETGTTVGVDQLVAIVTDQTHSGVEKAAKLLRIKCHKVTTTSADDFAMTAAALEDALTDLRGRGLHPFFACMTLGTTPTCAVDDMPGLKSIFSRPENRVIWTHLDAAYAGSAMILPSMQHYLAGSEDYDSFEFNAHKWLLTNFDCSCLWLQRRRYLIAAMDITPSYLRNEMSDAGLVTDYRNWGIPLGRRFRALKLWFVMRTYGLAGLREHIQRHLAYSDKFVDLVQGNRDMEIIAPPRFALCVLKFRDGDAVTRSVYERINREGKLFLTASVVAGDFVIRVVACAPAVTEAHLVGAYETLVRTYENVKAGRE
ncbi:Aromatic-L-amino-acid decarboxylase [Taphrina deformans PYCC 5710]|uniref:Aromatic-L-amino-acid decarboxylase n=1 Tax=Taphrina deformans (strain PYCC 5710 / ATCC 11124 / CBS 356.35 / IMI 108563 / JCM 9778 / NBRC 8474) TaxID=1097556 RepID=R4XFH1_TAPDE|nr:Aromatic-L-amino-acid decarboxylase [Taphrina deformans PYCC 5710]|eukprot:CCG83216.1 Aromatic-L-amino-acid decarboxylase [Taphrina deformans PYCC 5710]